MNAPLFHPARTLFMPTLAMLAFSSVVQAAEPEKPAAAQAEARAGEPGQEGLRVTLTPEIIKRFRVTTRKVEPMVLRDPIIAPGTVAFLPEATVHVGTVVLGRVAIIHAHLGDAVGVGDPLLTIESPELGLAQNEWLQRRAAIAVAEADVGIAEQAHLRAQLLARDHNIAGGEAQRREGDFLKAQAGLLAAKVAAQAAENALRIHGLDRAAIDALARTGAITTQLVLRAALAGTVIASGVTVGEVVRPETESLMTIADTRHLVVVAQVPSAEISAVSIGDPARITTAEPGGAPLASTVSYIAHQVEADTRTVQVRLLIDAGPCVSAGSFVTVDIATKPPGGDQQTAVIAISREALFSVGGAPVVFVEEPAKPGTYAMRRVATAPAKGSLIPVISGVEAGDAVVERGGFVIKAEFGKAGAKDED